MSNYDYLNNAAPTISSALWLQQKIEGALWNQYLPYQLVLVEAVGSDKPSYRILKQYVFTLPIPPQDIAVDMPLATNVQPTLTGIVETHGGAPFKNITLNGTTGIIPNRVTTNGKSANYSSSIASAIFGGTISAIDRAKTQLQKAGVINAPKMKNVYNSVPSATDSVNPHATGYYQMRLLEQFLERYVELKKSNKTIGSSDNAQIQAKNVRLALAVWKEEAVYLCSGVQFTKRKSASDPNVYTFSLQLKAYARVQVDSGVPQEIPTQDVRHSPNALTNLQNKLNYVTDALKVSILKSAIKDSVYIVTNTVNQIGTFLSASLNYLPNLNFLDSAIKQNILTTVAKNYNLVRADVENLIGNSPLDTELANAQLTGADVWLGNIDPDELKTLLDNINITTLPVPADTLNKIRQVQTQAVQLTSADFKQQYDVLKTVFDSFSNSLGAGDDTYNKTYGLNSGDSTNTPSNDDFQVLYGLSGLLTILESLSNSANTNDIPTSLEYVAGLAQQSGIAFTVPTSKFPVPFPYGMTLERLAQLYLGDPDRWHEIATLNGLREPYVDEEGFSLPLLTNANGNQVLVSDATNLFVNQTVWLSANGTIRNKYHIVSIDKLSDGMYLIGLDNLDSITGYATSAQAKLEAFLPGTVNSQQIIYIPSNETSSVDPDLASIPGVDAFDPYLNIGGVDLLLTQSGDLVVASDGDSRLAYGLTNIVQTIKLALATPQGALLGHPEYGMQIPVGISTADVSPQRILKAAQDFFSSDPTFTGVKSATVAKDGNTLRITMEVGIAGVGKFIPVTIAVNTLG